MQIRVKAVNPDCRGIFQKSLIFSEPKWDTTMKNTEKCLEAKNKLVGISESK